MIFIGGILLFLPLCCTSKFMKIFQANVQHHVKQKNLYSTWNKTVTKSHIQIYALAKSSNLFLYWGTFYKALSHKCLPLGSLFSPLKDRRHVIFVIQFVTDEEKECSERIQNRFTRITEIRGKGRLLLLPLSLRLLGLTSARFDVRVWGCEMWGYATLSRTFYSVLFSCHTIDLIVWLLSLIHLDFCISEECFHLHDFMTHLFWKTVALPQHSGFQINLSWRNWTFFCLSMREKKKHMCTCPCIYKL